LIGKYNLLTKADILDVYQAAKYNKKQAAKLLHMSGNDFKKLWEKKVDGVVNRSPDEYNKHYKIAAISDLHLGSNYQQLTSLFDFMEECQQRDITTLLIAGDICDGLMARANHVTDRFLHNIDDICEYTYEIFDRFIDQFKHVYIQEGNHDVTLKRHMAGFDLCRELERRYSNVVYIQNSSVSPPVYIIDGKIKAVLYHGSGNCNKGLVDRTRLITAKLSKQRLDYDLLIAGHCHGRSFDYWSGKYALSVGCWQAPTPNFEMNPKMSIPTIGGYIIDYQVNYHGDMYNVDPRFFGYNKKIRKSDY
jgi:predicted phosphodiesterase